MASSEARRRKQLEKKKKKRTEKQKELTQHRSAGMAVQLGRKSSAPVYKCIVSNLIDSKGIGVVYFSRILDSGEVICVAFLVDRYCRGVADCFVRTYTRISFDEMLEDMTKRGHSWSQKDAATTRRLIEDAAAYATAAGVACHKDYRACKEIFGTVDPAAAETIYEMGKNGKPFYIPGPHTTMPEIQKVLARLTERFGESGFDHLLPLGGASTLNTMGLSDGEEYDEDFNDDDYEDDHVHGPGCGHDHDHG
ncbi:MAG: hypothetical protein JNL58_11550 [Planctomyces sp.]|nr:hypothetical protein [Planctomyces sp.]